MTSTNDTITNADLRFFRLLVQERLAQAEAAINDAMANEQVANEELLDADLIRLDRAARQLFADQWAMLDGLRHRIEATMLAEAEQ